MKNEKVTNEFIKENIDPATGEIAEESAPKAKKENNNKIPQRIKLLYRKKNKDGDKIGVYGLLYDAEDESGVNIMNYMSDTVTKGKNKVTTHRSPIVSGWFPIDDKLEALLDKPIFSTVWAVVSGKDSFIQMHGILSDSEAELIASVLGNKIDKNMEEPF